MNELEYLIFLLNFFLKVRRKTPIHEFQMCVGRFNLILEISLKYY